jgi:hypothetical protein
MNEPTKTTEELLADLDADLLQNPNRSIDDLLLEIVMGW